MNRFFLILINNKLKVFIVIILLIISTTLLTLLPRMGKNEIVINVLPENSEIFIDNKKIESRTVYLKNGWYMIRAKKSGFRDDVLKINIKKNMIINLLPEPNSKQAYQWVKDNPAIQQKREEMGGEIDSLINSYYINKTPIREILPYYNIQAPFAIDYGVRNNDQYETYIEIHDTSTVGREKALQWIRQKGYNPTDLDIYYSDFINPFFGEGE